MRGRAGARRWPYRAALAILVVLAPLLVLRDPPRIADDRRIVRFEPLAHPPRVSPRGKVAIAGAWRMTSPNDEFGSYSALVALPGGRLAGFSDRGAVLEFAPPASGDLGPPRMAAFGSARGGPFKRDRDCEAVTRDPASGMLWAAYERNNAIVRLGPDLVVRGRVQPAAMRGWPDNRGPEAMVRLADGRFVVLAETRDGEGRHAGLLFSGDPVAGARPLRFRYRPPAGFRPTDMAELPDGRVLVLNRKLLFPWRFQVALVVADPGTIDRRATWRGREIARLAPPLPLDNYEGLAVRPEPDGTVTIWLISDDNQAALVQRTLLLELKWKPERRVPAA